VASSVAAPTISNPPAGVHNHALWDSWYQLAPFGYNQREYFVSGTASDGAGATAPYTTRIIVFRPTSPTRFNGTVMLDWTNVTAQFENAVDTMETRQMLMREGFAFVHVSAQTAGICCTPLTPKTWDPVRYGSLNHPGDQYANDIFSQIAQAVRAPKPGINPMGNLHATHVLASGQSQSASKLYSYVNDWHASANVIDGFLIHGGGRKTFPAPLTTKVLHLLSDNEANPEEPSADPNYRLWEIAGTAHSDYFIGYQSVFGLGARTTADAPQKTRAQFDQIMLKAGNYGEIVTPYLATCVLAGSTMPMHYAASSALFQLDRWAKTGVAPKMGPRFEFTAGALAQDQYGNTKGGVRMPPIDVPVAEYQSTSCPLGGLTVPFSDAQLKQIYPTHAGYLATMKTATDKAVRSGWLLKAGAYDLMRRACTAQVRWGTTNACPTSTAPPWNTTA
jgi:hypothetical protein